MIVIIIFILLFNVTYYYSCPIISFLINVINFAELELQIANIFLPISPAMTIMLILNQLIN